MSIGVTIADSLHRSAAANEAEEKYANRVSTFLPAKPLKAATTERSMNIVASESVRPDIHATDSATAGWTAHTDAAIAAPPLETPRRTRRYHRHTTPAAWIARLVAW